MSLVISLSDTEVDGIWNWTPAVRALFLVGVYILVQDRRHKKYSKSYSWLVDSGRGNIVKENVGQVPDISGKVCNAGKG